MLEAVPLSNLAPGASVTLQEFIARKYIELAQNSDRPQIQLKALEILRTIVDGPDETNDPDVKTQVTLIDRIVQNSIGERTRESERQVTHLLPGVKTGQQEYEPEAGNEGKNE